MMCPVCKGSGVSPIPRVPDGKGGWLDETYYFLGLPCGGCNGTGVVPDGAPDETPHRSSSSTSGKGPAPLAGLEGLYANAVHQARRLQKDLLDELERRQLDQQTMLEWSKYWKLREWARRLDVEAVGVEEEVAKEEADMQARRNDYLTWPLRGLHGWCSQIADFRYLIQTRQEKPTGETK